MSEDAHSGMEESSLSWQPTQADSGFMISVFINFPFSGCDFTQANYP